MESHGILFIRKGMSPASLYLSLCCMVSLKAFCGAACIACIDPDFMDHKTSVVAKKLGCRLKIKFRRLKEELKCPLCFTDSSPAKNPAGNLRFFSR